MNKRILFVVLLFFYLISLSFKLTVTKNGNFPFWFDVGRDAIVSRDIIEKKDIKIQGPNASGTQDTVYHGVLYYYVIGPLYTLFNGDPRLVLIVIAVITSLTVFVVYRLTFELSDSIPTSLLAAFLYATSYDAVRSGTWLSNPSLAALGIPLFFLLLYRVFWKHRTQEFPWLALVVAFNQQSVIFFGLELVLVAAVWWYHKQANEKFTLPKKYFISGVILYLIGVSSMILAQFKAYQAGIFTLSKLAQYSANSSSASITHIAGTVTLFLTKLAQVLLPSFPVLAMVVGVFLLVFIKKQTKQYQVFMAFALTSPLWLLALQYRNMIHSFIGLEAIVLIVFAGWLMSLKSLHLGKVLMGIVIGIYLVSQVAMWKQETRLASSIYFVPQGAYFKDLLAAVDYTYETASGQPFTISTVTNPYGYNAVWAYLYSWYGQQKYGYEPGWYGADQTGLFGGDLLTRQVTPEETHFSIWEPGPGIPTEVYWLFEQEQNPVGTPSATEYFGTVKVEER